jgi:phage shock protein PspC (stress-responsive transcriptional regulator)
MVGMTVGTTEQSAESAESVERLSRSRHHKVIGGVCGGLGRHYHIDPVVFRVPLAVLSVIGGLGFVGYGLAWLIVPFEGETENEGRRLLSGRVEGPGLTALLFIVVGCGLALAALGSDGTATWFSMMVLAALAGAAHWSRRRSGTPAGGEGAEGVAVDAVTERAAADAPPEAQAPPVPARHSWWGRPAETGPTTAERASGYLWGPAAARPEGGWRPPAPPADREPREAGTPAPVPAGAVSGRREFRLGGLVLLLAMAACAIGTAAGWSGDALSDALVIGLASALAVFGLGLVVSAFVGRLGTGTIVAVVLTSALLAGAAALPGNITTSWSEPVWRPAAASQVLPRYEVGSGRAELHLSHVDVPKRETVTTRVEAGAGEVEVFVPREVTLTVHTDIGAGAFSYDGRPVEGGFAFDSWGGVLQERTASYPPQAGIEAGGTVELWLDIEIGQVSVHRTPGDAVATRDAEPSERAR